MSSCKLPPNHTIPQIFVGIEVLRFSLEFANLRLWWKSEMLTLMRKSELVLLRKMLTESHNLSVQNFSSMCTFWFWSNVCKIWTPLSAHICVSKNMNTLTRKSERTEMFRVSTSISVNVNKSGITLILYCVNYTNPFFSFCILLL